MLVLTRKPEESIILDGNIEITVLEIVDGKVRLGIIAPASVKVIRKEVLEAVAQENRTALEAAKKILKK